MLRATLFTVAVSLKASRALMLAVRTRDADPARVTRNAGEAPLLTPPLPPISKSFVVDKDVYILLAIASLWKSESRDEISPDKSSLISIGLLAVSSFRLPPVRKKAIEPPTAI